VVKILGWGKGFLVLECLYREEDDGQLGLLMGRAQWLCAEPTMGLTQSSWANSSAESKKTREVVGRIPEENKDVAHGWFQEKKFLPIFANALQFENDFEFKPNLNFERC
jgi:hypothetical protein